MIVLETKRLALRTWENADTAPMVAISQDPKVMEYFPAVQREQYTKKMIEKINKQQEHHGYSLYVVERKDTHEMIGFVGLLKVGFEAHFTPAVEIGWRLAAKQWGQGYATEAANAVLNYGLTTLGLKEIVSFTAEINTRSQHVMEKIGMKHNFDDDFDHPKLEKTHPLCRHVLYRINVKWNV